MSKSFMLPEWAPCHAVLIAWPYPSGDWANNYDEVVECYWGIVDAISKAASVWVLVHPSINFLAFKEQLKHLKYADRVHARNDIPYNDTWIRDYGPISCSQDLVSFTFDGWGGKYDAKADNQVALLIADWLEKKPQSLGFVCEGGGLEINADQVLLANEDCIIDVKRNPRLQKEGVQNILRECLGVKEFAWLQGICLTGDDTDGHIDTIARFAPSQQSSCAIIYSGRNDSHHDAMILHSLHQQVAALAERWGWALFELPTPIIKSRVDGRLLPATYANFLICNNYVFAPIYGLPEDATALKQLVLAFPEFDIVPVPCAALLEQHGSLHCATMQVSAH